MAHTPQDVTDTELGIMEALWEEETATIRRLTELLYPQGGSSHYATIQKLLERLEAKGFVRRKRDPAAHTFSAAVGREELIGRRLQATAEKLCGGSWTPILMHLLRSRKLTAKERQELRSLIAELEQNPNKLHDH